MRQVSNNLLNRRMFLAAGLAATAVPAHAQEQTGSLSTISPKLTTQGKLATKTQILADANVLPILSANSISAFSDAIALYEEIVAGGGWPQIPKVKFQLKKRNPTNILLRQRLVREGYLDFEALSSDAPDLFDDTLLQAVKAFQTAHGSAPTGQIDARTLAELNITADARLADLRENLGRIRLYLEDLSPRAILVNIPSVQLETVENGHVYARHNVIVGKLQRPTPTLKSKVSDVIFNPFWNAPASIVAKDIIPKYLKDPNYLDQMNIKVFDGVGGPEIDPSTVDWATTPTSITSNSSPARTMHWPPSR
jgi:L,D-transpeptidase YcbB